jgi:hypothetical protein
MNTLEIDDKNCIAETVVDLTGTLSQTIDFDIN